MAGWLLQLQPRRPPRQIRTGARRVAPENQRRAGNDPRQKSSRLSLRLPRMISEGLRARQSVKVFEKAVRAGIGRNVDETDLLPCRLALSTKVFGDFVGKA